MLVTLKKPGEAAAPRKEDALSMLLECHERIRKMGNLASVLATVKDADPAEVSQVAFQLVRYFRKSLPLHVEDDDRELLAQQPAKRLLTRTHRDEVEPQRLQHRLDGEQVLGAVVDEQDPRRRLGVRLGRADGDGLRHR